MLIDAAFWLLHHFFDGHVREVLRVEHEAVVLVELGEAQPRLVVAVGDSGSSSSRDDALRAKARILQTDYRWVSTPRGRASLANAADTVTQLLFCQLLMGFHLYDVSGVEIQENGDY